VEDVLALHDQQIAHYGGSPGVRDLNALGSAVAAPQFTWQYERTDDLFLLAATYLCSIVWSHPFNDANKRTGLHAAITFLGANGIAAPWTSSLLLNDVVAVATRSLGKDGIARTLRLAAGRPSGAQE
jgi:death-on-curing protein